MGRFKTLEERQSKQMKKKGKIKPIKLPEPKPETEETK